MTTLRIAAFALCSLLFAATADGQKSLTVSYSDQFLNIVSTKTYDGTSAISEASRQKVITAIISPTVDGIDPGDDVAVSYDGFFADASGAPSSDVNSVTQIFLTFSLTGADADKYTLTNDSYTRSATITPLDITGSSNNDPVSLAFREAFSQLELIDTELRQEQNKLKTNTGTFSLRTNALEVYKNEDEGLTVYAVKGYIPEWSSYGTGKKLQLALRSEGNDNYTVCNYYITYCNACASVILPRPTFKVSPSSNVEYGTSVSIVSKNNVGWNLYLYYGTDSQTLCSGNKCTLPAGEHVLTAVPSSGDKYDNAPQNFTITVSPRELSIVGTPSVSSRPYNGTCRPGSITLPELDKSNVLVGDTVSLFYAVDTSQVSPAVGTYSLVLSPRLTNPNYTLPTESVTIPFTITKATAPALTISGDELPYLAKTYDGTTALTIPEGGVALPDYHARITKAYFASKNAGSQEIMIVVEADDNYTLDDGTTSQTLKYPRGGTITLRPLTLNGDAQVAPKVYDGTTGIEIKSITLPTVDGIIDGDDVSLRADKAEADAPDAGNRNATIGLSIYGDDAMNYTLATESATITFTITKATAPTLTLSGDELPYLAKTYDGTTALTIPEGGVALPDCHARITKAYFASKNAGSQEIMIVVEADDNYTLDDGTTSQTLKYPCGGTITLRPLTLNGDAQVAPKVYDGTTGIEIKSITLPTVDGIIDGDDVSLRADKAEADAPDAGNRNATIGLSIYGDDAENYTLATESVTIPFTITKATAPTLTISGDELPYLTKTYDGTTALTTPEGGVALPDCHARITKAYFASKNAGSQEIMIVVEADDNYTLDDGTTSQTLKYPCGGTITLSPLTLNGDAQVAPKVYDGTTGIEIKSITLPTVDGMIDGDDVSLRADKAEADAPDAGNRNATISFSIYGDDAENYTLATESVTIPFTITKATAPTLTISGDELPYLTKTYDGTTALTIPEGGVALPDCHAHITKAYFASKNAGSQEIMIVVEADDNYTLDDGTTSQTLKYPRGGTITLRPLTLNGDAQVAPKVYDGTTGIEIKSITLPTVDGIIDGDDVSLRAVFAEADDAAPGERIATISLSILGSDAKNYTLGTASQITAPVVIKPRQKHNVSIVLRGDTTALQYGYATIGATPSNTVFFDVEPLISGTAYINGVDAGMKLPAGLNTLQLKFVPQDTMTYAVAETSVSLRVAPHPVSFSGTFSAVGKTYDGTTDVDESSLTLPQIEGAFDGDDVSLSIKNAFFATKSAGENTVYANFELTGKDALNYTASPEELTAETKAEITPRPVTLSGSLIAQNKMYDGTTDVDAKLLTLPNIKVAIIGDDVSLSIKNAFFATKSAGENTVYANFELTGKDALNYTASPEELTAEAKAEITPRPVTLSSSLIAQNKVYDGTTDVDAKLLTLPNIEGAIIGNDISLSIKTAFFATKSAGENTVFANFELTGKDAFNYTASPEELTAAAKAEILPKPLTANPSAAEIRPRIYDGTTSVADSQIVALPTVDGIVGNDDVTTSWTAEYESAEVGRHIILLTCGLAGHDAANYMVPDLVAIMGEILAREAQPSTIVASLSSASVMRSCGEYTASLSVIMTSGTPSTYNIAFDDEALAAGFVDVVNQPLPEGEDGVVGIDIATPQDDIVGVVGGSLSLADADGTRGEAMPFVISLRPSASTIGIKFGNTLFVDNSANLFTAYQWYADGREIPSAARQFYHASPLPSAQYSVRLTMADGDTLSTCPYTLDLPSTSAASGLSVSPNPAPRGTEVRVFIDGMDRGSRICVEFYDASGSLCESRNVGNGETISISLRQGIYAVRAKTEGVNCGETKIAVK